MASEHRASRLTASLPALLAVATVAATLVGGCHREVRRFPLAEPMAVDGDMRPYPVMPEEYYSPFTWDAADQLVFRRLSRLFAVDPAGEAVNVNALDEVPDSSWWQGRLGARELSDEEIAKGPCLGHELATDGPWQVTGAKPDGYNPGFLIKSPAGQRYLLKFDGLEQPERATSADVVSSRLYWAVGFNAPCNSVVFFERDILALKPGATAKRADGKKEALSWAHIDTALAAATRLPDGRYRAAASLYLDGRPLGPWTYNGRKKDDPNDVIAHEDRRELRGGRVIAAWTNHFDAREQNTLAMWQDAGGGQGWVKHYMLDFGDTLGSLWAWDGVSRRLGHANYFDFTEVGKDLFTFGVRKRPWEGVEYNPRSGIVWGYFRADRFEPEQWKPGYPNPAFGRMSERDGAWMARKIARIGDRHVRAIVAEAKLSCEPWADELGDLLIARRDKVLRRWLSVLSPLDSPRLGLGVGGAELCLEDTVRLAGLVDDCRRRYRADVYVAGDGEVLPRSEPVVRGAASVCVPLPEDTGGTAEAPSYVVVDVRAMNLEAMEAPPARVHLYHLGGTEYRLVGLERPERDAPPRLGRR